ncbi:MAG: sugar phosphate isomerase/epimerase family protein [Acidobacteriota bacterium]
MFPHSENQSWSRRRFVHAASLASALEILGGSARASKAPGSFEGTLCLFSKHLPDTNPPRLAKLVKQLGFDGVDLTVRRRGHVLPENTVQDLPRAVAAIRDAGLAVPMITTELLSAADPAARPILSTAGSLGIPYYKAGYYRYRFADVTTELEQAAADFRSLVQLGRQFGIQAGYHNHAGSYVGAPVWDIARMLDGLPPESAGYYFDIRHAVVEGGDAGWKIAAQMAAPRIKMISIKDFFWEKTSRGWQQHDCPLGQGMVDWKQYFEILARAGFRGPVSLHIEYDIAGSTPAAVEENTLVAVKQDLDFLKARLAQAYSK